jgi:hypothetical protein
MEEPSYKFNRIDDKLTFEFDSVSSTKTVKKLIEFSLIDKDYLLYNLALVDILHDGTSSDLTKSNNQDMSMVLSTVFQSVVYFFDRNPKARILIQGSTKSRTRLYQMAIAKYIEEIEQKFNISGYKDIKGEVFKKGENYDSFVVSLKLVEL